MNQGDRDFLEEFRKGISAQLKANSDVQDMIYTMVKDQNGRVRELQRCSDKRGIYWKFSIPVVVIIFLILYIIIENTGLGPVLLKLF